jgi:glycosyltransferase involved in cell wall biosynthesis
MRVGLDVRYVSHGLTGGVRTYVYHLASELPHAAPDVEFFYYADSKAPLELELDSLPRNVTIRTLSWSSPVSSIVNDVRMARWMRRDRIDVAHFPANYGASGPYALVVTVHDALNLFPMREHLRGYGRTPRKVAMMLYLGWKTRRTLARADHLLTVSEHARHDIASRGHVPVDRITAIHEAAAPCYVRHDDPAWLQRARTRHEAPRVTIVADAIKNPGHLIQAWQMLPDAVRHEAGILFFSREPMPRPELAAALAQDSRIRFLRQPTTPELVELLNIADVFVFPSFYEGFGLPLVEAMSCGAAIIASTRGAIPEVVGEAGLLFDLEDPGQLATHLAALLTDASARTRLREASMRRAHAFSWSATARQTVDVYRRVHTRRAQDAPAGAHT